jgi:hypothetical protein
MFLFFGLKAQNSQNLYLQELITILRLNIYLTYNRNIITNKNTFQNFIGFYINFIKHLFERFKYLFTFGRPIIGLPI